MSFMFRRSKMAFHGYEPGAIQTREQLLDLIIEARKEKKAVRLFCVAQGGALSELCITSRCKLGKKYGIESVPCWYRSCWDRKWHRAEKCLGDVNIGPTGGSNNHMLFQHRKHAVNYANKLSGDPEYLAEVAAWHRHCDAMFGGIWA